MGADIRSSGEEADKSVGAVLPARPSLKRQDEHRSQRRLWDQGLIHGHAPHGHDDTRPDARSGATFIRRTAWRYAIAASARRDSGNPIFL